MALLGRLFAGLFKWIGPLIIGPILDYARSQIQEWWARREEAKKKAEEIRLSNDAAIKKLQEAKSEEERIKAGADLLKR